MDKFLNWSYWFSLRPVSWQEVGQTVLLITVGLVVLAILLKVAVRLFNLRGLNAKILNRLFAWSLSGGLLGLLFWFFREQRVPFFSARFWWLVLIVLGLVWLGFIFVYWLKKKPEEKKEQIRAAEFDKYLPSKK